MLYFIKGRAGSGKTRKMRDLIETLIKTGESMPVLMVPDQFSFETERAMLRQLGARNHKKLQIFSFKRLAYSYLKNTPEFSKNFLSNGMRAAIMSESLVALDGRLNVFSNLRAQFSSLNPLVDFCNELKYCDISSQMLADKCNELSDGFLKEKLADLNLINEAYTALVSQSYFDDTDAVGILADYASKNKIFKGKTIYIDGFRELSKQEYKLFSLMLLQADNVYLTLCTDEKVAKNSPFDFINKFEKSLRGTANEVGVDVSEIRCNQKEDTFSRDIYSIEKNLYSKTIDVSDASDGSITIVKCADIDDECAYVAATIKKLVRSGYCRCRDIAVIERTNGTYKERIIEELKKLDLPVFNDSRRSLKYETLFVYLNSVLSCITGSFQTENILSYLKSGLSKLSLTEISRLEKYALVWGVNGKNWREGFTMHPDGFGNELDSNARLRLDEINKSREKAVGPILKLKNDCEDKTGKEITEIIFNFLEAQHISDRLFNLYTSLNEQGFPVEANRQQVSWDVLINILDEMAVFGNEKYMTLSRWFEIFTILIDDGEIGEIPQGLDEITVGSADRIRTDSKKVCFLVGVNKDEFPLVSVKNGILTDSEREFLNSEGLEFKPSFKESVHQERFIAYCAVTASSQKLYLSYKTVDSSGAELYPSEIIDTARSVIPDVTEVSTVELDPLYFAESDDTAFSLLAKNYTFHNEIRSTLLEYFRNKSEFQGRLRALENVAGGRNIHFENSDISKELFRENMYLSASRVEAYYNCPFSYFMRYGLNAEPLRVAELDPAQSGTIVHLVMEEILKKYPKGDFINTEVSVLRKSVEEILKKYIEEKMGGLQDKSKRFIFLYNHLVETCVAIINRLKDEFSKGSFVPCGFEVEIGGKDIPPYELDLDDGKVSIKGSVDRVDMYEKDGIKYIRIIDYKTGKKEFVLSELFDGLNIQMVLYLMALEKNGKEIYGDFLPAGVLYLPSKIGISDYMKKRFPDELEVKNQKKISGKLSGMMLKSLTVFNAMGAIDSGKYYPASFNSKKNAFSGNTYSQLNFSNLSSLIDEKIKEMGNSLHQGLIPAIPAGEDNEGKMCKYCSYRAACGYESGDEISEISSFSHKDAIDFLGGDSDE